MRINSTSRRLSVLLCAGLSTLALCAGCKERPSRIAVKGPADTLAAAHGILELPVFDEKNATMKLRVSAFDDQDRYMGTTEVKWKCLDPTVASVSQTGLVTVLSSGKTKVVAATKDLDPPIEAAIEVEAVIIDGVKITSPAPEGAGLPKLPMGEFLQFQAEVLNDRGEVIKDAEIRWESTTWAATVSITGEVEGRAIGKTSIVANAANGDSDAMEIEITDWPKKRRR